MRSRSSCFGEMCSSSIKRSTRSSAEPAKNRESTVRSASLWAFFRPTTARFNGKRDRGWFAERAVGCAFQLRHSPHGGDA